MKRLLIALALCLGTTLTMAQMKSTFAAGDGTGTAQQLAQTMVDPQEQWASWRHEWLEQKRTLLPQLRGLSDIEQNKRHMAWLLYQAPPLRSEFAYLRYEDLFMLATKLQEWESAQSHLNAMVDLAPKLNYGVEMLLQWVNQLNYIPAGVLDRTQLFKVFQRKMEDSQQWMALANFYAANDNPQRNIPLALSYVQKENKNKPQLRAFETQRTWEMQHSEAPVALWYREQISKKNQSLLVYWWSGQYQQYCQSLGGYAQVNAEGIVQSDTCVKK